MADRPLLLNIDHPTKNGLLEGRSSRSPLEKQVVFRNSTENLQIFPVRSTNGGPPYKQVDLATLTGFRVGVGLTDEEPEAGTWPLSVNGTTTGMLALAFDVSAAALEALIDAVVPVTVSKSGSLYTITVVATNTGLTLVSGTNTLTPSSQVVISNPVAAAVGVQAVYQLTLKQIVYAYTTTFSVMSSASFGVTLSTLTAGSATAPAVYKVIISPDAIGGSFRFSWQQVQKALVTVQANTAVAAEWRVSASAGDDGTSTAWTGNYIDVPDSSDNPVRFYYYRVANSIVSVDTGTEVITFATSVDVDVALYFHTTNTLPAGLTAGTAYYPLSSGTTTQVSLTPGGAAVNITSAGTGIHTATLSATPATPTGGAVSGIEYTTESKTASQMLALLMDAANAYSAGAVFSAALVSGVLRITALVGGERSEVSTTISAISSIATQTEGSTGALVGTYFVLNDGLTTTVCVYITGGTQTDAPDEAADYSRSLPINLTGGETATNAALAIKTALILDSAFTNSTVSGNQITAINTGAGPRGTTTDATAGAFSVAITQDGFSMIASVDYDSSAQSWESQLDDAFFVSKSDPSAMTWVLTRTAVGSVTAPTVTNTDLVFPIGIDVALSFNGAALQQKFYEDDVTEVSSVFSIKATFTGKPEEVWLQTPIDLNADLLNEGATGGPQFNNVLFGVATVGIGDSTVAVTFTPPFYTAPKLMPFPIIKTTPGDAAPLVEGTQSVTTTGGTIVLTGAATVAATIPWMARIIS
jgi:hypothetical protein